MFACLLFCFDMPIGSQKRIVVHDLDTSFTLCLDTKFSLQTIEHLE